MEWTQLGFLTLECAVAASLVMLLLRLRDVAGLGPLWVTVGSWQFLQSLLAQSFYVPLGGGLSVSPGSTALFAANLFAVLLVYVRLGAVQARRLVYGILSANLILVLWSLVFGWHLARPETQNLLGVPSAIFALNARLSLVGTAVTALDVFAIALVWELVGRHLPVGPTVRAGLAFALVLAADALLFSTGAFAGTPLWLTILVSGLAGKLWCAVVMAACFGLWLRLEGTHYSRVDVRAPIEGLLSADRESTAVTRAARCPETGLYTEEFLWDVLSAEVDKARRAERAAVFVLFDLDRFRAYVRMHGPEVRARVLAEIGKTLLSEVGPQDLGVRYSRDQFALLLHHGGSARGHAVATAVRRRLTAALRSAEPPLPAELTLTAGVSEVDAFCSSARALTFSAESRVHRGKEEGRNRVVSTGTPLPI